MRKSVRWLAVIVWVGLLGVFLWQEVHTSEVPAGLEIAAVAADSEGREWYGIYVQQPGGKRSKIGYASVEREQASSGIVNRSSTYMRLAIQGAERVVRTESKVVTGFDHRLQYVDFSMRSDLVKFRVLGTLRGDRLELEIHTAGGKRKHEIEVPEPPLMPDNIAELLADEGGLRVGNSVELPYFDPATFRYDKAVVRVTKRIEHTTADDRQVVAFRVETDLAGATAIAIVDEEGRMLEQQLAGIVMVREPHQAALTAGWHKKPVDLPEIASIRVDRPIKNARKTKYLQVRLLGVNFDDLPLAGNRQEYAEGVLTVDVPALPAKGGFTIPYVGGDEGLRKLLAPSPLLEVNDPLIQKKAQEIVPPHADALAAARAIHDWVYENLEKKPLISMTSAKDVLLIKRGDCNEHAALFTALARAAGLPAQIHVGLVYLNGAFYYHAWNGVYVGKWITIDATFGQFPADATHLRLVTGGLDRQVDIIRVMGNLSVEVLEFR